MSFYPISAAASALEFLVLAFLLLGLYVYSVFVPADIRKDPVVVTYLIFVAWLIVSSLLNEFFFYKPLYEKILGNAPFVTLLYILTHWEVQGVLILFVFYALIQKTGYRGATWMFRAIVFMYVVGLLGGYIPYITEQRWLIEGNKGLFRTFHHWHTSTAKLLNIFIPFSLAGFLHTESRTLFRKLLYLVLFYAGTTAVYLTSSRGGIGILIAVNGCLLGIYLMKYLSFKNFAGVILIVLGGVLIIGILPSRSHSVVKQEIKKTAKIDNKQTSSNKGPPINLGGRISTGTWPDAIKIVSRRPIIGYQA
ncbi:MAG: hypothetical protein ABEJ65_04050, partial [bacterium]